MIERIQQDKQRKEILEEELVFQRKAASPNNPGPHQPGEPGEHTSAPDPHYSSGFG